MTTGSAVHPQGRLHRDDPPAADGPPPVRPDGVGIVHLGIGAFHRAHQAVFTEDAMRESGESGWGILGVSLRSSVVRERLRPQGGLYAVHALGPDVSSVRLIGAVVDVAHAGDETARVLATITAASTQVITLTVTEKGYTRTAGGGLDVDANRSDLDALAAEETGGHAPEPDRADAARPAHSAVGLLVRGLAARRRAGGAPITVLSCDNVAENGAVLAGLVDEAVAAALPGSAGAPLRAWLADAVTFPSSMVDRITPTTTRDQVSAVARVLGVRDEALVVAEPFMQWVIEDRFAGRRPAWDRVGVTFTDDVRPYERAKLRLLNGTHSLLAYAGSCAGHATIADAVADPRIAARASEYLFDDALPTLQPPHGMDLQAYGRQILERFANPHTRHATAQVATDGTVKIPLRWAGVAAQRLTSGAWPGGVVYGLAAWAAYVTSRLSVRNRVTGVDGVDDPRIDELRATVDSAADSAADVEDAARRLLALPGLLPTEVVTNAAFVDAVATQARAALSR